MILGLITLLSILSLLFCVAVCPLWIRSYWRCDALTRTSAAGLWGIEFNAGAVTLFRRQQIGWAFSNKEGWELSSPKLDSRSYGLQRWRFAGFARSDIAMDYGQSPTWRIKDDYWTIPDWSLVAVAAILPLLQGLAKYCRRAKRRHRLATGRCPHCGYDLPATPGHCPECGAVPTAQLTMAIR